jgi:hypothetical protein
VRYETGFYIPEGGILHSHRRENLKSYAEHFSFIFTFFPFSGPASLGIRKKDVNFPRKSGKEFPDRKT